MIKRANIIGLINAMVKSAANSAVNPAVWGSNIANYGPDSRQSGYRAVGIDASAMGYGAARRLDAANWRSGDPIAEYLFHLRSQGGDALLAEWNFLQAAANAGVPLQEATRQLATAKQVAQQGYNPTAKVYHANSAPAPTNVDPANPEASRPATPGVLVRYIRNNEKAGRPDTVYLGADIDPNNDPNVYAYDLYRAKTLTPALREAVKNHADFQGKSDAEIDLYVAATLDKSKRVGWSKEQRALAKQFRQDVLNANNNKLRTQLKAYKGALKKDPISRMQYTGPSSEYASTAKVAPTRSNPKGGRMGMTVDPVKTRLNKNVSYSYKSTPGRSGHITLVGSNGSTSEWRRNSDGSLSPVYR